jgi:hypothetical protein
MYIPSIYGNDLVAYKFVEKNKPEPQHEPKKREVDEFGRDINRNVLMKDDTDVSSERTYSSEESNISRAEIQRENAAAAEEFIQNYKVPVSNRI